MEGAGKHGPQGARIFVRTTRPGQWKAGKGGVNRSPCAFSAGELRLVAPAASANAGAARVTLDDTAHRCQPVGFPLTNSDPLARGLCDVPVVILVSTPSQYRALESNGGSWIAIARGSDLDHAGA